MKIKLLVISLFSIYDMIFNILLKTEDVINQTINLVLLAIVIIVLLAVKDGKAKKEVQFQFVAWGNICYWFSMGLMYLLAAYLHPEWEKWVDFNLDKEFLFMFFSLFLATFFTSWFMWKIKKIQE